MKNLPPVAITAIVLVVGFAICAMQFPNIASTRVVANLLERMDQNKDGKISKDEARGPLAQNFADLDRNKDGSLVPLPRYLPTAMSSTAPLARLNSATRRAIGKPTPGCWVRACG